MSLSPKDEAIRASIMATAASVEATWPQPRPDTWKPLLLLDPANMKVTWHPEIGTGSRCFPLSFILTDDQPSNSVLIDHLLEAAWQSLETERMTGKPPVIAKPGDDST